MLSYEHHYTLPYLLLVVSVGLHKLHYPHIMALFSAKPALSRTWVFENFFCKHNYEAVKPVHDFSLLFTN